MCRWLLFEIITAEAVHFAEEPAQEHPCTASAREDGEVNNRCADINFRVVSLEAKG